MKKNHTPNISGVDDERAVSNEFKLRSSTLYESFRPMKYYIPEEFHRSAVVKMLDTELTKLFENAAIDEGNGNVMDGILLSFFSQALADLRRQRVSHMDTLERLRVRHEVDSSDAVALLKKHEEHIAALEEELKKLKEREELNS